MRQHQPLANERARAGEVVGGRGGDITLHAQAQWARGLARRRLHFRRRVRGVIARFRRTRRHPRPAASERVIAKRIEAAIKTRVLAPAEHALVVIHRIADRRRCSAFHLLHEERTRAARDQHLRPAVRQQRTNRARAVFQIHRVDHRDVLHARRARQRFDVDLRFAGRRRARMRLMARHARRAVVEHDQRQIAFVPHRVDQAGNARMKKSRIADERNDRPVRHGGEPARATRRRAHANEVIAHVERRVETKRVAADVRQIQRVVAHGQLHRIIRGAMRTARTQNRRTRRQRRGLNRRRQFDVESQNIGQCAHHLIGPELTQRRKMARLLAENRNQLPGPDTRVAQFAFQQRVELFDNQRLVDLVDEIRQQAARHGKCGRQMQYAHAVGRFQPIDYILDVTRGHSAGQNTQSAGSPRLIERGRVELLLDIFEVLFHHRMAQPRHGRQRREAAFVGLEHASRFVRPPLPHADRRPRMRNARGRAQQHRRLVALRKRERFEDQLICLFRRGRFEHRDLAEPRVVTIVLLVLRTVATRIVRGDQHQPRAHADVRQRHQRIGRYIHPDVLHRRQRAHARGRRRAGDFQRDFFVDRILELHPRFFAQAEEVVADLRTRRTRIGRNETDPRLQRAAHDRFVAE